MTIPFDQLLPPPFVPGASPTPTPSPTPPVTIPFDQLLPPPFVPSATPTPTPTPPVTIPFDQLLPPTFIPSATPAASTPTPTPTPTPPSFQRALTLARNAVVELKAGGSTWTGIVFNARGDIIASSQDLGNAPLADFRFADGTSGQAWAHGRNDDLGLALLRPVGAARTYPFLPFASGQPAVNAPMGLIQFSGVADAAPTVFNTRVTAVRPGFNGRTYLQIQAADNVTTNGAVVVNAAGQIQGIRMPSLFLLNAGVGGPGQVFACTAADIGANIPLLQSGIFWFSQSPDPCDVGTIPPIPIIYQGSLSVNGQVAPAGTRVYARVRATGRPDVWKSVWTNAEGQYTFPIAVCVSGYNGATIEFWSNAKKASATSVYNWTGGYAGAVVKLDLAF